MPDTETTPTRAFRPLAPLWARVLIGAGAFELALRLMSEPGGAPLGESVFPLAMGFSPVMGALIALGEERLTRRAIIAYSLGALLPLALAYLVVPAGDGRYTGIGRTLVGWFATIACLGGIVELRMPAPPPAADPLPPLAEASLRFARGAAAAITFSMATLCAAGAIVALAALTLADPSRGAEFMLSGTVYMAVFLVSTDLVRIVAARAAPLARPGKRAT